LIENQLKLTNIKSKASIIKLHQLLNCQILDFERYIKFQDN